MYTVVGILPNGERLQSKHGSSTGMRLAVARLERMGCVLVKVING